MLNNTLQFTDHSSTAVIQMPWKCYVTGIYLTCLNSESMNTMLKNHTGVSISTSMNQTNS